MNKGKTVAAKKVLIRNTKQNLPKTRVENDEKPPKTSKSNEKTQKNTNENDDFELPELYSALNLAKKMEEIGKHKKTKSTLTQKDSKHEKLAIDEKVTKKMNFPYDQPIYRDLIQLNSHSHQSTSTLNKNKYNFNSEKDVEPILSDFTENYAVEERFYKPSINSLHKGINNCSNNNLRLYNILKMHE